MAKMNAMATTLMGWPLCPTLARYDGKLLREKARPVRQQMKAHGIKEKVLI